MTTTRPRTTSIPQLYEALGGPDASDVGLVGAIAQRVQIPREEPANSFILHAPLELLARAALLSWVAPAGREIARLRLTALLAEYEAVPAATVSALTAGAGRAEDSAATLVAALQSGDLDATDDAAQAVAEAVPASHLASALGDAMLPSLAAAGHAPIFLFQLPRVAPRGEVSARLLRPLARELARYPQLRIEWVRDRSARGTGSAHALTEALSRVPVMGEPGSSFIYPVMHQVDDAGVAAELLGPALDGITVDDASRVLLRTAARAMLMGPVEHAPYGWTHTLTMSQAALEVGRSLANPQLAIDVGGTYVVGMLAALATETIPDTVELPNPGGSLADAIRSGRDAAAGWAWHAPIEELTARRCELATRACARRDAHIVKYALACFDAAATDPAATRLYLTSIAALLGYWESVHEADDPLLGMGQSPER